MPKETVSPLLDRRLITGDRMMIAHVYLKKGCIVPKHQHENEQITYILEGELKFWIGEDESQIVHREGRRGAARFRRTCRTRRKRSRIRSTSTSSIRRARIGSTRPTRTCGNSAWISVCEAKSRWSPRRAAGSAARSPTRSRPKARRSSSARAAATSSEVAKRIDREPNGREGPRDRRRRVRCGATRAAVAGGAGEVRAGRRARHQRRRSAVRSGSRRTTWAAWERRGETARCAARSSSRARCCRACASESGGGSSTSRRSR